MLPLMVMFSLFIIWRILGLTLPVVTIPGLTFFIWLRRIIRSLVLYILKIRSIIIVLIKKVAHLSIGLPIVEDKKL